MKVKKFLFIGGSSVLAYNWSNIIKNNHEVVLVKNKTAINQKGVQIIDVLDFKYENLISIIEQIGPDVLINCAAITNIEYCEKHIKESYEINLDLPSNLAKITKLNNIKFIQISTDHLFNGKKNFYSEKSIPDPLNVYAKTKHLAEKEVLKYNSRSLIIRTNFFGWTNGHKKLFPEIIIDSLQNQKEIKLFEDVFFNPVDISVIQKSVDKLINTKSNGIFNISSNENISKYEFGVLVAKKFNLDSKFIRPISIDDLEKRLVLRPKRMSLCNNKIKKIAKDLEFEIDHSLQIFKDSKNKLK